MFRVPRVLPVRCPNSYFLEPNRRWDFSKTNHDPQHQTKPWMIGWYESLFSQHPTLREKHLDVSENSGFSPQIIHFNRDFHYKPSILGVFPLFFGVPPISRLWQLIQSLPPLISSSAPSETTEGAILHFTKKTAIELLGHPVFPRVSGIQEKSAGGCPGWKFRIHHL